MEFTRPVLWTPAPRQIVELERKLKHDNNILEELMALRALHAPKSL